MSPILHQLIQKATTCVDRKQGLEVHGVRIMPPFIQFKHAFEGRTYRQNLTIQNVGKSKVVVKITKPTSLAFSIKEVKGHTLSPGLSLSKEVSYVYMHANVPYCLLPLYIDNKRIDYEIFAQESSPEISFEPRQLDFGLVDANFASGLRIITIRNDGSKTSRFFIDTVSPVGHKYMADPNKGNVLPKSSVKVHIKIASSMPGRICDNLWLKCDKPYSIPVTAEVINPCFEPIHDLIVASFSVVEFPPTYIGVISSKTMYIRNYSANAAMFCIKRDLDATAGDTTTTQNLKESPELAEDSNYFDICPKNGVWDSKEVKAFHLFFNPAKLPPNKPLKHFYFGIYNVHRVKCRYLRESIYEEKIFGSEQEFHVARPARSVKAISDRVKMAHASVLLGSTTSSIPEETKPSQKYQCMKLYVHAVAEKPSVTVIPDEIKILNLAEGQQEVRVLNFQNNSKNLPIFISYQKVTYVDVDPSTFSIDAAKSIEISVSITPRRMGRYTTMLQFDLKYYDESPTKKELKVIGKASVLLDVDIKCSKKAQLPKIETSTRLNRTKDVERLSQNKIVKRSVVVIQNATAKRIKCDFAFPRDSPWKFPNIKTASKDSLRCTQSIDSDRGLTIFGEKMKIEAETYHSSYLKRTAKQLQLVAETKRASDDYDLTDVRKLLYENFHLPLALKKKSVKQMCSEFIPLSPTELNNLIIDPIFVYTERVAVHSEYTFELTIKNSNTFPIRVYIRPEKSNITFPKGNRHVILGNDAASLPITYVSTTSGYYTASLDIIVNECSVFVVNIMADVSPIFLNLSTDAIEFTHENTHFVEIFNPLNADTTFRWSIRCQNFSINPIEGVIKGNSQIACQVTYLPTEEGPPEVEAELLAFEIVTQVMRLSIQSTDNGLRFVPQELMFNDIPLNVPIVKEVLLRNESTQARVYGLMESEFLKYADVYPSEGIVYGNSHALIWVTLKINTCVTFSTKLKINIKGVGTLDLAIKGNVAYPDIIIRPPLMKFQQIPASTVRTSRITVENRSKASASIKFDMSMYSEYKITETKCYWEIDAINEVMLQANSSKHLYFHFMPNAMITDEFCLPFIVNDIIGPSDAVTKKISLLDANIPSCKKIATPLFYSVPKIRIYTTAHKLKFSHLRIFLTYKIPPLPCKYEYNLKISNPQRTEENFCFRTDTLTHPFYITHARGKEVTFYEKSIVCSLSSEEEVVLNIAFKPDVIGTFNMLLPIFLMSDMIASPHNTLFVEGVFKLPEIVTTNVVTYHKPGALLVCNTGTIRLSLNDHLEICKLGVSQEIRGWTIEFIEETSEDPRRRTVLMNFTFTTDQIGVGAAHHCITCTCGASSIVTIVGYRENCFLTNYAQVHTFMGNEEYNFQLKNTGSECSVRRKVSMVSILEDAPPLKQVYELDSFFTEYPFFPEQDTELKEFLEPVVEALEDWVSTQGFFGICFYSIPIEFAYVASDSPTVIPPFIQLLLNLTENKLEGYFDLRHPGVDDVEKVRYLYELYEKALAFLQSIGALFVYVRPELLLGYTPYMVFLENFEHDEQDGFNVTITNRQEFYRLSKQYWLDVLLQTYKVLVLKRLFFLESGIYKPPRRSTAHERYSNAIKKIATNKHLLSNRELLLLNWFEFHYNDVRNRCWLDNPYLEEREITFFGENMTDGFVYAAVIITYCPFLVTHFRDMCKEPLQPEEILHNNIKVLQSWRIMNFNIKVTAEDITEPNSLKTLMIMTYLCQMLPDMHPYETLYFTAGLSQHSRKTLVVKNVNDFPIAYKAILYGDDSECFNVNEFYVIPPQSKCKIVIDYWAKFIRRTYCTLILSGECLGYHYATSNVVTLVGNPDITFVTMEKEIQGELHSVVERTVEVKSPYQSPALYKIQFTIQQPTDIDGVNSLSYELPSIRVCRFLPVVNWMNVDDDGGGFIDAYIMALTTIVRPIWVFFRNPEVGDFAIKVITSINIGSPVREVLRVSVPKTIEQVANGQFQTVNLQMPVRNKCVWDMAAQMFTKSGEEEDFWRTYVPSNLFVMSPICHQLIQKAITNVDRKPCLEVHGVCITPPFIHFKHAFEGRTYRQNLTIRNVGKSKVVVKITKPTSLAFGIKEVKGHTLSPGLCFSKEVSHVFRHANVPYCILPIYIDGKCIDYEIFAEQSAPEISFEPKHLDFGLVDTHCTSALRIITIRNDGSQPAKFFIDTISPLGHKYMADPNKGNIQPKSAVNIHIKIASTSPGEICDNLWLDCHKTFAIPITAQIIKPLFEPIHELVTMSFPIVEFPPTYIGVTSSRTMYIRNYSANAAMFCVNGRTICQTSNLEKYRELIENYNYFKVYPKDGVLESKEVKVFHFSFNPVKPKRNEKLKHFYFCVYHISRIKCRYLRESIYEEQLLSVEQEFHVAKPARSVKGICDRSRTVTSSGLSGSTSSSIRDETKASGKYVYLKLYLYATAEEPSVSVIPDEIRILDLTEGQREARVLKFQNHSEKLPIIISYQKATYVDVDPPTFTIEANKSIEISVSIIPRKVGRHTAFLQFDLKYHDESLIKKELKVIGKVSVVLDVDVKCAKKLQLPQIGTNYRQNCVLSQDKRAKRMVVALRSDTAKRIKCALPIPRDSLWKASKIKSTSKDSHPCTQGVDSERVLTVFGKKMKIDTGTYYSSHVKKTARQLVAESKKSSDDYDLSDVTKLLCKNDHLPLAIKKKSAEQMYSEFIPLSPAELGNVTIDPIDVHTERIAVHSVYNFELTIKNSNTLPIKIYIKPEKANITFPKGNRQVILANNVASLPITYTSATSGYYTASLEVVVNDCSVFVVNIMADVSPIFVNLSTDAIEFTHENTHFVEISNPLNADTNFRWSIRCRNFSINPVEGVVKGNSQIACQVTYLANQEGPSHIDAELIVFDVVTHQVKLSIKNMIDKFRFVPQKLIFQDIPLNISVVQKVQLRNESVHPRVYSLVENEFLKYADVYPADGIVYGSSYTLIRVTLKVKAHIRFSTTLKYQVIGVGIVELPIEGNVIYPDILVSPQALKFQTIPASTFQTMKITVQNRSKALASIKFDMSMYSECKITEAKYYWRTDPVNELMLKANSSQHLYFHFIPQAITSDQFCLPIILNDIISLSPSSSTSKNISHYQLYTDIPSCGRLLLPTTFITPIVRLYATAHKLKFPNVQVYLTYKIPPLPCKNEYNLKISNPQKTEETFCIRTDELAHPFYLTHASGNEVTFYEKSIVCILDPKEEVILNITFKPDVVGTFSMSFPIYLKSDMTTHPHNILYVEGVFKLPEITTSNLFTYNKPGPLLVSNTANVELHLTDHLENCKLWISQEVRGWTIEFIEETSKDPYRRTVLMVVKFVSEQVGLVVANHCVSCSCGARRTVTIAGCRENCFLTNYAQVHTFITNEEYNLNLKRAVSVSSVRDSISLESVPECTKSLKEIYEFGTFFTEYPFFPEKETPLKEFLQPVVELMEHWAHTQGFFGNYFCAIPRGFACVIFNRPVVIPPFIELLLNITENELEDYFDLRHPGDEYVERVKYVYELYAKALDFLQKIGALFVYVRPEMLLGYTPYTAFVKNFDYEDEGGIEISIANRREFYRLSKQYWLDVLLQTYKVLVLKRLFFTESGICRAPRLSSPHERYSSSIKQIALQKHLFSNRELLLLNWFEFHYNDVRQKFWLDNPYLEERKITFFGENMTDGFVYAAVVIAYCPFLVTHFQDMCKQPLLPEEILHNNAKVIQSWRILNFSMKFTVEEIAKPNSLKVLIIMTYLYQMLPNMYPWETLSISAGLSQHSRKALVVKNVNSFPIAYKMILYGKDSECFNVNKFHVIPAKSKCKIVVDYWAKFIRETFCTLILSGECSGYHYASSNVINLVGNPDISFVVTETATQGDLYSVTTQIVKVNSPYHCAAIYQIQFTDEQPSDINEVNSLPHGMLPNNVYRFHPAVYSVNFDSEGFGFMKVHLICLTSRVVPVWVFFRNAEVGDFAVKVITSSNKANVVREVLRVSVPKPDETDQLANEEFRTVNLQVPTRNKAVWETVADVFIKTLGENEEVWHTYAHTTVGIHILQNTLIYNKPFYPYGFCEPVQYRTKVAKDCRIKFPKYVDIEAECSLRMIDVPIQIPRTSKIPTSIDLELMSVDGFQQRHYRIVFTNDSD